MNISTALYLAVLGYGFATGLYAWPPLALVIVYVLFWIVYVKLMPDEERRMLASVPGMRFGKSIGRGVWVAAAWFAGYAMRTWGGFGAV